MTTNDRILLRNTINNLITIAHALEAVIAAVASTNPGYTPPDHD